VARAPQASRPTFLMPGQKGTRGTKRAKKERREGSGGEREKEKEKEKDGARSRTSTRPAAAAKLLRLSRDYSLGYFNVSHDWLQRKTVVVPFAQARSNAPAISRRYRKTSEMISRFFSIRLHLARYINVALLKLLILISRSRLQRYVCVNANA